MRRERDEDSREGGGGAAWEGQSSAATQGALSTIPTTEQETFRHRHERRCPGHLAATDVVDELENQVISWDQDRTSDNCCASCSDSIKLTDNRGGACANKGCNNCAISDCSGGDSLGKVREQLHEATDEFYSEDQQPSVELDAASAKSAKDGRAEEDAAPARLRPDRQQAGKIGAGENQGRVGKQEQLQRIHSPGSGLDVELGANNRTGDKDTAAIAGQGAKSAAKIHSVNACPPATAAELKNRKANKVKTDPKDYLNSFKNFIQNHHHQEENAGEEAPIENSKDDLPFGSPSLWKDSELDQHFIDDELSASVLNSNASTPCLEPDQSVGNQRVELLPAANCCDPVNVEPVISALPTATIASHSFADTDSVDFLFSRLTAPSGAVTPFPPVVSLSAVAGFDDDQLSKASPHGNQQLVEAVARRTTTASTVISFAPSSASHTPRATVVGAVGGHSQAVAIGEGGTVSLERTAGTAVSWSSTAGAVAVTTLSPSVRESGLVYGSGALFPDDLTHDHHDNLRLYSSGHDGLGLTHMIAGTSDSDIDSVLVNTIVKNEPEDLTGRQRHGTGHRTDSDQISLDVTAKTMGIVTSPDGDSIILDPEDLPLAPGFPPAATVIPNTSGYEPPFTSSYTTVSDSRIYPDPGYREEGLYDGPPGGGGPTAPPPTYHRNTNTYYLAGTGAGPPGTPSGLSVDLPSPDSGIGPEQMTPREIVNDSSFDYSPHSILEQNTIRRQWPDYARGNSDTEKVQIAKVYNPYGFKYYLDAATSSSVKREDDKVTYINKGQFYGVTLEYVRDPEYHIKSPTVKSVIMLVFREGKSQEDEIKAWQFWHQRQHSVKQRIIDVDTKNSHGLVGHIEELSHNAIAVYWNPLESFAKVNLAVQCLSTDFSTQKGVKGLPLHIQIDTYEDPRQEIGAPVSHRGYCQVKIFCDKGAERKLRDEEKRAAKRRMTPNGKRRLDEMYHETFERTDFYSMSDLNKPPTLFTPPEDGFQSANPSPSGTVSFLKQRIGGDTLTCHTVLYKEPDKATSLNSEFPSFYHTSRVSMDNKPVINGDIINTIHVPEPKRARLVPPTNERIMVYVRQETEDVYTPLHLVPPTVPGLIGAIENKYKINATNIRFLYRKNREGIVAKIDDDMLRHYCNEDVFLMQVMVTEGPGGDDSMVYDITLSEIQSNNGVD